MVWIVFGMIFFLAALSLFTIGISNTSDERSFRKRAEKCEANIIEYIRDEDKEQDIPLVSFMINTTIIRCLLKSRNMSEETHPPETSVEVAYCRRTKDGAEFYDVRMADKDYAPFETSSILGTILIVCAAFLVLAVLFITVGVLIN